jgi:hypothetical protein
MGRILGSSSCVPPGEAEMVNRLLCCSRWRGGVRPADAVVRIGSRVEIGRVRYCTSRLLRSFSRAGQDVA